MFILLGCETWSLAQGGNIDWQCSRTKYQGEYLGGERCIKIVTRKPEETTWEI
jgi:hypothetical protein